MADHSATAGNSRAAVTRAYRADEAACVATLIANVRAARLDFAAIAARAAALVQAVRKARQGASGVDHLMHEFSLSSHEGIALMCLAEALLRIPDATTRDRLIRDKLATGDWGAHLGHGGSLFVNAAAWGLMLTGRLVAPHNEATLAGTLAHALARGGEPLIRHGVEFAMGLLGRQFVMGETIEDALERSRETARRGYRHSFDMLGEAALTATAAARYISAYDAAIHAVGRMAGEGVARGPGVSVKLSALHPRYCRAQRERVLTEMYPRLLALARLAADYEIGLTIDAEESERLELSLDLIDRLLDEPALAGWQGLGVAVQTYQKRAPWVVDHLVQRARAQGRRLTIRLVKGAYWDSEIKRAQVDGVADYPVFTRKSHTDLCYLVCAHKLLTAADVVYAQFATHNAHTLATVEHLAATLGVHAYEFQCLHGMGEALYDNLVGADARGIGCRIYAPVGRHDALLPYLVRRLLENGANASFVNRIVDANVAIAELVVDPLTQTCRDGGTPHPAIPLPRDLYGAERVNAAGVDLANEEVLRSLDADLARLAQGRWDAAPILARSVGAGGEVRQVVNPADGRDIVGAVREASASDIADALATAADHVHGWHAETPAARARMLRRAAELFEERTPEFMSLCIREAGKTWPNAVAELREAVDFCRYYAAQIEKLPRPEQAPGIVVCISPWNFPLAIFVGQVVAALAAGSPVLAKPAEQTPLVACHAVRLLHAAGIPRGVLQCLPGRGESVGAALTGDPRVRGVIFTGSGAVARVIKRALAERPVEQPQARLIAETGGQNAMIVDSSAQIEQAVQDILTSGFDSAGQRCSALRVLYLQEEIADDVLDMLRAAMRELRVSNPRALATDIGPVIDADARSALLAHIAAMSRRGCRVFQCELPPHCTDGLFVPPTLIEIDGIAALDHEVFGPVVHVVRYAGDELDAVVNAINATGYGLTFGMHSRIDAAVAQVAARVRAGNIYINRNMVGAVVGVQPFGGSGQSGTGPKAGGPFYLPRLLELAAPATSALGLARHDDTHPAMAALAALATWAGRHGRPGLAAICAEYAAATPLPCHVILPGPTGEDNRLDFLPRGEILCVANTEDALLKQLAAVLATGNTALVATTAPGYATLMRLPDEVGNCIRWLDQDIDVCINHRVQAIVFAGTPTRLAELQRSVATGEGALVPVIVADERSGLYPLYRLVRERVVCINTTAAGGNATLMSLAN